MGLPRWNWWLGTRLPVALLRYTAYLRTSLNDDHRKFSERPSFHMGTKLKNFFLNFLFCIGVKPINKQCFDSSR